LTQNRIAFKVSKPAEKAILQGHPWVFESSIVKQSKEGNPGDIAIIYRHKNNKLLAVGLFDPNSIIRIKVLEVDNQLSIDQDFFGSSFSKALGIRSSLLQTETNAFRLIYGENDQLPGLVIDIYDDVGVIKLYSEIWIPYLDLIKAALLDTISISTIVLRLSRALQNRDENIKEEVIHGELDKESIVFKEHGLKFSADPIKGHKTGYFLDHRHNRLAVRHLARGKTVLDVFAYAGGFSVNAIAGGAKQVIALDISKQALDMASANVELNFKNAPFETLAGNAFEKLDQYVSKGISFDLLIIDPPSFAKRQVEVPKAIESYKRLIKSGIKLVSKNGVLLMASCSSRISKEDFYSLVTDTIKTERRKFEIIDKTGHDIDHPSGIQELEYLKSVYIKFVD
jgi:23S rRNA (cytosine1962-C5)-methyltransferase